MARGRPVQSLYLMLAPQNAPLGKALNLFAWRVKNWIRPLGLAAPGWPSRSVCSWTATWETPANRVSASCKEETMAGYEFGFAWTPVLAGVLVDFLLLPLRLPEHHFKITWFGGQARVLGCYN
jgi:hypothetical protein